MPPLLPLRVSPLQNLSGYLVLLVVAVAILYVARWVYRDATARESEWAWQWAFLTAVALFAALVPGVVVLALYWYFRRRNASSERANV